MTRRWLVISFLLIFSSIHAQKGMPFLYSSRVESDSATLVRDSSTKIIFVRPYHFVNGALNCPVYVDGHLVAVLKNNSYHSHFVTPGRHEVTYKNKARSTLELNVRSDETTYVTFEMTERFSPVNHPMPSLKFTPVDSGPVNLQGKKKIE
jgi:hypothetical protein